jgi:hypothetical protein
MKSINSFTKSEARQMIKYLCQKDAPAVHPETAKTLYRIAEKPMPESLVNNESKIQPYVLKQFEESLYTKWREEEG